MRRRLVMPGAAAIACVLLVLPASTPDIELLGESKPFRWDADELFAALKREFVRASAREATEVMAVADALEEEGDALLARVSENVGVPYDVLERLAALQLEFAVQGAALPSLLPRVQDFLVRSRVGVMRAAPSWPMNRETHDPLYR